jgi:GNAT superfamily N-acetyltransferase
MVTDALIGEKSMIAMIEKNLFEIFVLFRRSPRIALEDTPELLLTRTPIPFSLFNSVLRAQVVPERADETIQCVTEHYDALRVPIMWWVSPSNQPDDLGAHLLRHDFCLHESLSGMGIHLRSLKTDVPAPSGFTIRRVEEGATYTHWCQVVAAGLYLTEPVTEAFCELGHSIGFEPQVPLRHYVGYQDGVPVAACSANFGTTAVGVYNVATIPDARRLGYGTQMSLRPLKEARAAGYQVGILHATWDSFGIFSRLGFNAYCQIGQYIWMPPGLWPPADA